MDKPKKKMKCLSNGNYRKRKKPKKTLEDISWLQISRINIGYMNILPNSKYKFLQFLSMYSTGILHKTSENPKVHM